METGKKWFDDAHHRQAKRSFMIVSLIILLIGSICGTAVAATQTEIDEAVEDGVAWLAAQQNPSVGYWESAAGPTGLALIKLQERAFELGYTPFDPCYPYEPNVEKGLAYLFSQMSIISTPNQPAGDPNTDGDGIGVCVNTGMYETGIAMMAIAASRAPDRVVNSSGSPVDGWTYKEVLVDMVDYVAFGQCDSGNGRGGWRYSPYNNSGGYSDNSCSGYAVSGLGYAESPRYGFNCAIPQFVKDELKIWIDYIQTDGGDDDGGSGYTGPGSANILRTGNLVFQMTFAGIPLEDPNMQRALAYIGRKWDTGWSGDCQAMYCAANGLWYSKISDVNQRDWYADFADALVNTQQSAGYWSGSPFGGNVLGTEWALLTLEMPPSGPIPPCHIILEKVDDVNDGNCVGPGDEINYRIDYNYYSGSNCPDINDVNIIDYLPDEVDLVTSDFDGDGFVNFDDFAIFAMDWLSTTGSTDWNPNCDISIPADGVINSADLAVFCDNWLSATGIYDPGPPRIVTWNIGTLHPGDAGYVTLKVRVKPCIEPGGTITNYCEIESGEQVLDSAYENTSICPNYPMLTKVDDIPNGNCVSPEDYITYNICYDANGYGDTNVVITDELPDEVNYVSSDPCGAYNSVSHTVTWDINFPPDACGCVNLVVKVNTKAEPGGTITNHCEMKGYCLNLSADENTSVCCWLSPVIYVDVDAPGTNNGTSWEDAFISLQDAIEVARGSLSGLCPYNEIRVAEGIYKPDVNSAYPNGSGDREATFELINGVGIKGGYAGFGEPDPDARDIKQYETILSGDLAGNDHPVNNPLDLKNNPYRAENSYHVVTGSGINSSAKLDGFTITGGYTATGNGGGMYNYNGSPTVINCTFSENFAFYGGGMYSEGGSPKVKNCIFKENLGDWSGGGMFDNGSSTVTNCIFIGNKSFGDAGIHNSGSQIIKNCIIRGNDYGQISGGNVTYSNIQDGWEGAGNIDEDPIFAEDGYHLMLWSPCIDTGDPNYVAGPGETDIDGEPRIIDGDCNGNARVDMGVDEYYTADCNVFLRAHCPWPANGATDVPEDVVLNWRPGSRADMHDVYFGTDFNDVNNANDPNTPPGRGQQDSNSFDPGLLEPNQYYWRVDEINGGNIWRGDVWYFCVPDYNVVDSFNGYAISSELRAVWKDGLSGNGTKSEVYMTGTDPNRGGPPYRSMRYVYKNYLSPYYAKVEATIGTGAGKLHIDHNWSAMGAESLVLWFWGTATNDANEKMYVTLTDGSAAFKKILYNGDMNDVRQPWWHRWDIPLTDFTDVDLSNVSKIAITFGDNDGVDPGDPPTGMGTVYFEDIRLYK